MTNAPEIGRSTMQAIRDALARYEAGKLEEAADGCTAVLRSDSGNFDALHLLGLVKLAAGDTAEAVRLLTAAVKAKPRSHEAVLNLGLALFNAGDGEGAIAQYDRALALRPSFPEALNNRGNALRALGRPEEALTDYELALALRLDYADALSNRAAVLLDLGRAEEALANCQQAIAARPDFAEAYFNRGNALAALGRHQRALASYDDSLRLNPRYGAALANKSAIFTMLHRHGDALAAAQAALALDPRHVDALINCGVAAQHLGRFAEAVTAYDQALAADPRSVTALRNRGTALRELKRYAAALADFDRLVEMAPGDADALCERGETLRLMGRHAAALGDFERALALDPNHGHALGGAAFAALNVCDFATAERLAGEVAKRVETGMVVSPFILLNLVDSAPLHATAARNYVQDQIRIPSAPLFRHDPERRYDRIRVAYVSGDFRQHPIGQLIVNAIERHDRARFEAIGISYGADDGSDLRRRLVDAFDSFHDVKAMPDRDAATLIHRLGVDIAVDLAGYTQGCRPGILALRPAPIAVNYLGYPGTMAAGFIDYVIADPVVLPFDQQPFYTEKIVHLPDSYQANDQRRPAAAESPTREAAGLPENAIVFCCFNNAFKIARPVFETWMRLLGMVEGSVLWLLFANETARDHLRREAVLRRIDPARLIFAERVAPAEHLARHRIADLFLDTLPYNAHTTASDALWAGLPVITCRGNAFAGRVGASLLTAVGLGDLIAPDLAGYEALALRLAATPDALAECKRRLEQHRPGAALFATARFVRHLEAAYIGMHALWRNRMPPQSFAVPAA